MNKYYVEVSNEHVSKVLDVARFWYVGKANILETPYMQRCTKVIEIETDEDTMKEIYSDMEVMGIRNCKRRAA